MTIKGSAILIVLVVSLASCSNRQTGDVSVKGRSHCKATVTRHLGER